MQNSKIKRFISHRRIYEFYQKNEKKEKLLRTVSHNFIKPLAGFEPATPTLPW